MDFSTIKSLLEKEFSMYRARRVIFYALIALPFLIGIVLAAFLTLIASVGTMQRLAIIIETNGTTFDLVILATFLASLFASYSIVGERVEKSLEPLLAAPVTDGELLLAKIAAAFLPSVIITWIGGGIYMVFAEFTIGNRIGPNFFPNWPIMLNLFLLIPSMCLLSAEYGVIISSHITDIRAGMIFGLLGIYPFVAISLLSSFCYIILDDTTYLLICAIVAAIDVGLFYVSRAIFHREQLIAKS